MLESFHSDKFEYKKLSLDEQKQRGILGRLCGIICDTKNPTRNGRRYSLDLWKKVFDSPIMKEKIANRCVFSELGHPADREEIDMEKICACLAEQPKISDDGKIYGVFDILDTANGRILKTLCDYGCNVGVSSRGSGDLITGFDGQEEVDPDTYNCETWDIVCVPAIKEARLKYVNESLDNVRYNKTLRTKLQESLDNATEADRKVMKEALETLNIDLVEGNANMSDDEILDEIAGTLEIEDVEAFKNDVKFGNGAKYAADVEAKCCDNCKARFKQMINANESQELTEGSHDNKGYYVSDGTKSYLILARCVEGVIDHMRKHHDINLKKEDIRPSDIKNWDKVQDYCKANNIEIETADDDGLYFNLKNNNMKFEKLIDETIESKMQPDPTGEKKIEKYTYTGGTNTSEELKAHSGEYCEIIGEMPNHLYKKVVFGDGYQCGVFETDLNDGYYWFASFYKGINNKYKKKTPSSVYDNSYDTDIPSREVYMMIPERYDDKMSENWWNEVIKARDDIAKLNESLNINEDYFHDITKLVRNATNNYKLNSGNITPTKYDSTYLNDLIDELKLNGYELNSKVKNHNKSSDDLSNYIYSYVKKDIENESLNINEADSTAVDNNEALVEELQQLIKANTDLETEVMNLQEKLSVCYAKESKHLEEAAKYKTTVKSLAESARSAKAMQVKVETLEQKINESIKEKNDLKVRLKEAVEQISKNHLSSVQLKENLSDKSGEVKNLQITIDKLNESINSEKSNTAKLQEALNTSQEQNKKILSQNKKLKEAQETLKTENTKLTESINQLQKDKELQKANYSNKLAQSKQIIEKYKKTTATAIDRYIDLQARMVGSTVNELKNRLPESYSFRDIDKACEELQSYKVTMSRLPYAVSGKQLKEEMKMVATPSKNESIMPATRGFDDDVDADLLYLAGK